ncbi:hypothetical protein SAMIE_1015720 [Sphingobium amiense]|uniref:Uncharacterized protein n=1 Tax=Sphingobium amiense TaxID=135719 RepID=A0A494W1K0_9SPHN|nr:hypothetical protein [Sphingobium amiense]BBD98071.1 hypothetical protein SAMIE_1015720 [Sphingobium amiense]
MEIMTLADARAYLTVARTIWPQYSERATREGWDVFNLRESGDVDALTDAGIERIDETEIFTDDDDAVDHVRSQMAVSVMHHHAFCINKACNSLRYHLWGADWVDSRCGPDRSAGGLR